MKRHYWLIALALLISLFIYVFYRTEKTVVNEILLLIVSPDKFLELRNNITSAIRLNEHIIYSLPEGLWVFCITLTSRRLFVKLAEHEFSLLFVPLMVSIGLELFQLLQFTNGRFDFWDIGASVLFWSIANYWVPDAGKPQNILFPFNERSLVCVGTYVIVYLAHVWGSK
jgi:hypothetical protein